jgi:phosphoserine phosphatase RsbU/P
MRRSRILVVDDEPGMLRAIERVLGPLHELSVSGSSREALTLASVADPQVAILDIRMPELDGFELMARLKSQHPGIDVILMTGSVDDQDEKLIRAIRGAAFYFIQKPFDRDVLRTLVDRCVELQHQREENRRHVMRLEREMAAARAFQQALLPQPAAALNGIRVVCRQIQSSELGGDLYDYASDASGRTAFLVADVAGHGASAAMLTAVVKSAFRACEQEDYDPVAVTERVRAGIAPFGIERFVTLVAARVSASNGLLTYVNAGHPAGLLWNSGGRRDRLGSTGPLLSPALSGARWKAAALPIAAGDHLLLYTDGVLDALYRGEPSEPCVLAAIEKHAAGGEDLLEAILDEINRHGGSHLPPDDITLLTAAVL